MTTINDLKAAQRVNNHIEEVWDAYSAITNEDWLDLESWSLEDKTLTLDLYVRDGHDGYSRVVSLPIGLLALDPTGEAFKQVVLALTKEKREAEAAKREEAQARYDAHEREGELALLAKLKTKYEPETKA